MINSIFKINVFFFIFYQEYKKPLFEGVSLGKKASSIYQALCLPVSVDELLQANQLGVRLEMFYLLNFEA
jgi:hypothetical protein